MARGLSSKRLFYSNNLGSGRPNLLFRYTSGVPGGTFTRASDALQLSAAGLWTSAGGNNFLRNAHYLPDGIVRTLLEKASTNLALWSSDQSNAAWGLSGGSRAAATSCINGQTASKLTGGNVTAMLLGQNMGVFVNGQTDTAYVILENSTAVVTVFEIFDNTAGAPLAQCTFTWATHTAALTGGAGSVGQYALPNGRWLVWVSGTGTAAGTGAAGNTREIAFFPTGTAANALVCISHHIQLEAAASNWTSPIVTGAATATRAVDSNLNYPFGPTAAQLAATGVTIYDDLITYRPSGLTVQSDSTGIGAGGIGSTNMIELYNTALVEGIGPTAGAITGPAGQLSITGVGTPAFAIGDRLERILTISPAGTANCSVSKNGAAAVAGAVGATNGWMAAFSAALIILNDSNAGRAGDMARTSVKIARGIKTLAQMRAA